MSQLSSKNIKIKPDTKHKETLINIENALNNIVEKAKSISETKYEDLLNKSELIKNFKFKKGNNQFIDNNKLILEKENFEGRNSVPIEGIYGNEEVYVKKISSSEMKNNLIFQNIIPNGMPKIIKWFKIKEKNQDYNPIEPYSKKENIFYIMIMEKLYNKRTIKNDPYYVINNLLKSLSKMHKAGYMHTDLTIRNIIDGKFIDFDISFNYYNAIDQLNIDNQTTELKKLARLLLHQRYLDKVPDDYGFMLGSSYFRFEEAPEKYNLPVDKYDTFLLKILCGEYNSTEEALNNFKKLFKR